MFFEKKNFISKFLKIISGLLNVKYLGINLCKFFY